MDSYPSTKYQIPVKPGITSLISMASNNIQHDQAGGVIHAHQTGGLCAMSWHA